ncbi:hypothetical protein OH76DRAFT_159952 [Lentinus brumalis]|uniref:Uncharacterized protein n=1 Tax=Lentinus brumalis TaxID=2498619 RepID=A0A371DIW3_9APHY|nr:hypothetical protein OH76DRAFT_159952 [Polyporus brumalis]
MCSGASLFSVSGNAAWFFDFFQLFTHRSTHPTSSLEAVSWARCDPPVYSEVLCSVVRRSLPIVTARFLATMDNRPPFDPSQLPPGDPRRQQQPYPQQPWFHSQQPQLSAAQQQQFYAQQPQPQQPHAQQTQPYRQQQPPYRQQQQPHAQQQQPYPQRQQPYPQRQQPHPQQQQPHAQQQPPYLQQQQPHAQQQQRNPHNSNHTLSSSRPTFSNNNLTLNSSSATLSNSSVTLSNSSATLSNSNHTMDRLTSLGISQGYPAMGPGVSSLGPHTHPPASNAPVAAPAGHMYRTPMPQHTQVGVTHPTASSMSRQTSASGPAPAGSQYLQTPGGVPTGIANIPMPSAHPQPLATHATQSAGGRPTGGGVGVVLSSDATVTQANSVSTPHTTGATTMTEIAEPPNLKLDDVRMTRRNFSGTLPVQSDPKRRPGYITDFPQFPQPGPFGSAYSIGHVFQYYYLGRAFIPASRSPYTRDRDTHSNNRVSMTPSLFEKLGTAFESRLYALWRHVPYDNKKWRPCFATWYEYKEPIHGRGGTDGVYLAPMYSSKKPDNPTEWADYNFDKLVRLR